MTPGGIAVHQFIGSCDTDGTVVTPVPSPNPSIPLQHNTGHETTTPCEVDTTSVNFESIYTHLRGQGLSNNFNHRFTKSSLCEGKVVPCSTQHSAAYAALLRERLHRALSRMKVEGHVFLCTALVLNIPWVMFLILVNTRLAFKP